MTSYEKPNPEGRIRLRMGKEDVGREEMGVYATKVQELRKNNAHLETSDTFSWLEN